MLLDTEAETAKILRVSERTLPRWREVGIGPAFTRLSTRRIVYSDKSIEEYVSERTFGSMASRCRRRLVQRRRLQLRPGYEVIASDVGGERGRRAVVGAVGARYVYSADPLRAANQAVREYRRREKPEGENCGRR